MTEREAPPNWGFDYSQADPYEDDGWFGREQATEPASANEVPDRVHAQPANNVRDERHAPRDVDPAPPPSTRRLASPTVSTWTVNGQLRATNNSALTFRAPPPPWYRTRQATIALIAVATAAMAVPIVLLAFRGDPATSPEPSTSVAPQPSTTALPVPSSGASTPINAPPPLPPPPPPPPQPPTEDTGSAPSYDQPDWTRSAPPPPSEKPDIGVTRTPATRAPISVAPVPRRPSETDLTKDSDKPGCAGWC